MICEQLDLFESLKFEGRTALRPEEVAERLNVSTQHVLDLVEEGRIRAINVAGVNLTDRRYLRIPVEAWERFVKESTV
jgi:excisionase family DNA binding protein